AVPGMCRELAAFGPDLVSTHTSKAGVIGRAAARLLSLPAVFTAHGWNFAEGIGERDRSFRLRLERFFARRTARIITVSEADRRLALRYRVGPERRIVTVH